MTSWQAIDRDDVLGDRDILYDSPDPTSRKAVNLDELPLEDELGHEINVYDDRGYRVARRKPYFSRSIRPCGMLLDLTKARALFDARVEIDDDDNLSSDGDDRPHLSVFPQAFTKTFGHIQSQAIPQGFKPLFRVMNSELAANADDENPVIKGISVQVYNHVQHNLMDRAGELEIVHGRITSALGGTRAQTAKSKRTAEKITGLVSLHLPHERVKQKLSKNNISRALRLEIVVTIDLQALSPRYRSGG